MRPGELPIFSVSRACSGSGVVRGGPMTLKSAGWAASRGADLLTGGVMVGRPDCRTVSGALQSARQWGLEHEMLLAVHDRIGVGQIDELHARLGIFGSDRFVAEIEAEAVLKGTHSGVDGRKAAAVRKASETVS